MIADDLDRAERLAAEFWTAPGDEQAARTLLVNLVARVRALTAAGDQLAELLTDDHYESDAIVALCAWVDAGGNP